MANTPWTGFSGDKLYLQSGQFTSTLKTSEYVGGVDTSPTGISYDGTDTPWCGNTADKLYLQSGQFSSTLKTSEYVGGIDTETQGISWDGTNTPWCGRTDDKLYLQSGQFTSTLKTSESITGLDPQGISYDGANTPWTGRAGDKLYLTSGQFTSTIKTSEYIGGIEGSPEGISWDGTNTPWTGRVTDKLYLTSGQFTSTLKTSEYVNAIDANPSGIDTDDVDARLGLGAGNADITLPQLTVQGGSGATGNITLPLLSVQGLGGATGVITLPIFVILGRAYKGSPPDCVVMNTRNFAVSEYKDYAFNSYTRFNSVNLSANQNGIYELDDTDTDEGAYTIKANVKSGIVDIHNGTINRLRDSYIVYKSDGDIRLISNADKKVTRRYLVPQQINGINKNIKKRRIKFERGIRNRFFDFNIENINGSELELELLRVFAEPIISKRR